MKNFTAYKNRYIDKKADIDFIFGEQIETFSQTGLYRELYTSNNDCYLIYLDLYYENNKLSLEISVENKGLISSRILSYIYSYIILSKDKIKSKTKSSSDTLYISIDFITNFLNRFYNYKNINAINILANKNIMVENIKNNNYINDKLF